MTERIFLSARLQYCALWLATVATPILVFLVLNQWVPESTLLHLGPLTAAAVGLVLGTAIHFVLRRFLDRVYLIGTAVYEQYKRERKEARIAAKAGDLVDHTQSVGPIS